MQLAEAKVRLNIPVLWELLQLRGRPQKCCRCPWREDRHPSFSVYADGAKWKDHGTGEHGDAVDFLRVVSGLSNSEACLQFIAMAKSGGFNLSNPYRIGRQPRKPLAIPCLSDGTDVQHELLAASRHISLAALEIAFRRGLLFFGNYRGYSSWFVTDVSRRITQARRLDGGRWWNRGPKALNIPGTTPSWPVGAASVAPFSCVIAVEGGPDLLSAFHFLHLAGAHEEITAVAILGANVSISAEALALFARKRIRVVPHEDQAGCRAAVQWQNQFRSVAAITDVFPIRILAPSVPSAKDLNDLCRTTGDYQPLIASKLVNGLM